MLGLLGQSRSTIRSVARSGVNFAGSSAGISVEEVLDVETGEAMEVGAADGRSAVDAQPGTNSRAAPTTSPIPRLPMAPSWQAYRQRVARTPTCLWRAVPAVIVALDDRFGEPVDAYVNGSQVWLRDDGPGGATIEWRLHPVPGYRRPDGVGTYDVFSTTALALATGAPPPAPLAELWEGLEAFAAYEDELEPATLTGAVAHALGIPPDDSGLVDHKSIGDEWELSGGRTSIVEALFNQLRT
jgi:hypothetical protein